MADQLCKGLIFRCRINEYINVRQELVLLIKMVPLKKKSCPGCNKCGWVIDELSEYDIDLISSLIKKDGLVNLQNGGLYELIVTPHGEEDYEFNFFLIDDEVTKDE